MFNNIRAWLDDQFESNRLLVWVLAGLTYATYYFGRYNFSVAHPTIAANLHWAPTDYGIIASLALLTYSLFIVPHGPLVDKIGSKRALTIGAIGAGIFNLLFGAISYFINLGWIHITTKSQSLQLINILAVIWAANSYFQTFGAISIVKLNTAWFQLHERGKQAGRFGALIQLGRTAVLLLCPLILFYRPWHWVFWIPSALLFMMAYLVNKYIKDRPEDAGFQYFKTPTKPAEEIKVKLVLKKIFMTPIMWAFALISLCIGITRNTIDQWFSRFYTSYYHINPTELIHQPAYKFYAVAMPIGMILAGLLGGWLSNRIDNKRVPIFGLSFLGQIITLLVLSQVLLLPWLVVLAVCMLMFSVQLGHCMIGGAVAQDWGGRKASGTAIAFFDGVQYLGGAIVTVIVGYVLKHYNRDGWQYWTLLPIPTALLGLMATIPIWNRKPKEEQDG